MKLKRPGSDKERALLASMLEQGLTDRQINAHFGGRVCVCDVDGPGRMCAYHVQAMVEPETLGERQDRIRQQRREAHEARQARYRRIRRLQE